MHSLLRKDLQQELLAETSNCSFSGYTKWKDILHYPQNNNSNRKTWHPNAWKAGATWLHLHPSTGSVGFLDYFFLNPSTEPLFLSEGKTVFSKISKNLAQPSKNTELILSLVLLLRPKLSYQHDFRQITWPLYEFPTANKNPPVTLPLYLISTLWMKNRSVTDDVVFRDWNTEEFLSSQTGYTTTSCGWMFHRTRRYAVRYLPYKILLLFESLCS